MKNLFTIIMILISMMSQAQNYTVKGVVIDSKGNSVIGAEIKAKKSKTSVTTENGGVFSLSVSPKEIELYLFINKYQVMSLPVSEEIAKNPIVFQMNPANDPTVIGYLIGDIYYVGEIDNDFDDIIKKNFGNSNIISKCECYIVDGAQSKVLTVSSPSQIYSIQVKNDGSSYGIDGKNGAVIITTKTAHENAIRSNAVKETLRNNTDDTLRGIVKDGWGRPIGGLKIKTTSGETAVSDTAGHYAIKISKKDKYLRADIDYTSGTTIRIPQSNRGRDMDLMVMLNQNELRGFWSEDMKTFYPGMDETSMESLIKRFNGVKYLNDTIYIDRFTISSLTPEKPFVRYIEVDGSPVQNLSSIEVKSIYSIKIIKDMAESLIYGGKGQYGAVIIQTKGMQAKRPTELTDWEVVKSKRQGGAEGMKSFIAAQGKGLVYDDGKIIIDGKTCELYIINDKEFSHMLGIEANMIDDIIIIRTGGVPAYGEKAKNGVVLISASEKEKKAINEQGETVTGKEAKKVQRKAKK